MKNGRNKIAIIIGAGPAGLTAAYELLKKTADIKPIIYEASDFFGGLATTVNYKGNRMDMGGHRFFSKSDRVMQWWFDVLPLQGMEASGSGTAHIGYQNKERAVPVSSSGPDPAKVEKVMLIRKRLSRIFYLGKFFDYPVALNRTTIANLGITRIVRIGASYMRARLFPIRPERSLEDFFINRFGKELYLTFFKEYTEKVWGVPCTDIAPEWGAQRIKGLSFEQTCACRKKPGDESCSAIPLSEIRTGADVGGGGAYGTRARRGNTPESSGGRTHRITKRHYGRYR